MISLPFPNRLDAAEQLAGVLGEYRAARPVILAIPRGAVPMGRVIADRLEGELDVVLVRKLTAPGNPEFAIGAIDENGASFVDIAAAARSGASESYLQREAARQLKTIQARRRLYGAGREPIPLSGRVVIVVDDGLATGATMQAALRFARAAHPGRLVCALPVAAAENLPEIREMADEVIVLATPIPFGAVGLYYADFFPVHDDEVMTALAGIGLARTRTVSSEPLEIRVGAVHLAGDLAWPPSPRAVVIFAHGTGSSRRSPRNRRVAQALNERGIATLLFDLLTPQEDAAPSVRFNVSLLALRLDAAVRTVRRDPRAQALPTILFGASTGAAAALRVAAQNPDTIAGVISRGGRPDLAGTTALAQVRAPTLLIVGAADREVLELNRAAARVMTSEAQVQEIPGATHLFQEPGALEEVAKRAADWVDGMLKDARTPA